VSVSVFCEVTSVTELSYLERVKGIEPSFSAWEADVLPLNYTRFSGSYVSLRPG
jgi:hypothetical protein